MDRSLCVCCVLVLVSTVSACGTLMATRPTATRLTAADTLAVAFEFDRVPLVPVFLAAFREQGLPVATVPATAQVRLTGAYSADYDLIHWRFQWAQFRLVRVETGEVLLRLDLGQSGLAGVESVVRRMVREIHALYNAEPQRVTAVQGTPRAPRTVGPAHEGY
jgi:hypothetical protein